MSWLSNLFGGNKATQVSTQNQDIAFSPDIDITNILDTAPIAEIIEQGNKNLSALLASQIVTDQAKIVSDQSIAGERAGRIKSIAFLVFAGFIIYPFLRGKGGKLKI